MNDKVKTYLVALAAFILGGVFGAGFGILVAPRSGEKTRKLIRKRSTEIKDRAIDGVENTRDQALETLEALSDKTRESAESVAARVKR